MRRAENDCAALEWNRAVRRKKMSPCITKSDASRDDAVTKTRPSLSSLSKLSKKLHKQLHLSISDTWQWSQRLSTTWWVPAKPGCCECSILFQVCLQQGNILSCFGEHPAKRRIGNKTAPVKKANYRIYSNSGRHLLHKHRVRNSEVGLDARMRLRHNTLAPSPGHTTQRRHTTGTWYALVRITLSHFYSRLFVLGR